ncbi:putative ammonium transporter 3 [Dendronephthya gigantea]|uniref:putative ammonium transporter 3 n=1 Tax=Dendronephthya gigantea TaxID=151771 RepID=UPI001069F4F6|nr:putative ammonium transporter 3 [Dendronephthya gigantea]
MESNLTSNISPGNPQRLFADDNEEVNSDDATWILTSAFIIFTMQSGFGLLESGLVSRKNEVNIMVKNAVDVIFGGLAYWLFGFALSFGDGSGSNAFSGMGMFLTEATDNERMGYVYSRYFFQLSFATTATTIVSGAMAERTNLKAYTAFSFFNTLTYCFPAHWIWAENGWLKELGAIDIAGSSAVHVVGGVSGLVATIFLKPRTGIFKRDSHGRRENVSQMASPTNVLLGTFMLWWGWLGFNCGSTFGISGEKWKLAARSAVCTINASIGGGIVGMFYSYIFYKNKLDIQIFVTGLLGGLVGVTAVCAITRPSFALVVGLVGGLVACASSNILARLHIDDPVGCVPVHLCSGVWSLIAVALFLEVDESGSYTSRPAKLFQGRWMLLGAQVALTVSCGLWSACITLILLTSINALIPVRMSLQDELKGSDMCEHGIALQEECRGRSAYGSRAVPRTDWAVQNSVQENGPEDSNSSISNQSMAEQGSTISETVNEAEGKEGAFVRSRSRVSEEQNPSVASCDDHEETNEQFNQGFSISF